MGVVQWSLPDLPASSPVSRTDVGQTRVATDYPQFRYMGSKHRLLPWIQEVLSGFDFETAADPFVGSGCVSYLMKTMGKRVFASDFLNFPTVLATATVVNDSRQLDDATVQRLLGPAAVSRSFIAQTFEGVFFSVEDLQFLDRISANIEGLTDLFERALARAALIRSCLKKQPRGVFTVSGDLSHYDDGRRDLRLSLEEHFIEQVKVFNASVFTNGHTHSVKKADVFSLDAVGVHLAYLDPPYVPRADDNCYIKRYHFLEGLSCYWEGLRIMENTKVRKIEKQRTLFGSRRTALEAFDRLFSLYRNSIIVLSYSSNGYPDKEELEMILRRYKRKVTIHQRPHRYHFGTHAAVERAEVQEYLIVGE